MFKLSIVDFHGVMRFSWDFGLGFWGNISLDHEHEFLFRVCVNDVVLRLFIEMDIWEMVWFWKIGKLFLVCSWEI
jgi:hypothetical protein